VHGEELIESVSLRKQGRPETNRLVSEVKSLFERRQIKQNELELLALTAGPGSFTGLRAAFTFAKTFGYTTGCPVKAVGTFSVIAEQIPPQSARLEVVEDLRQGHVATQTFQWTETRWEPVAEVAGITLEAWQTRPHENVLLAGGLKRLERQLPGKQFPESWSLAVEDLWVPQVAAVAAVGQRTYKLDGADNPFELKPLYVRRSAAEEAADRGEI